MKRLKTYKEFRKTSKQLDKEIKDVETLNKTLHKHHQLQQLRKQNYLLKMGIEKSEDNLGICK